MLNALSICVKNDLSATPSSFISANRIIESLTEVVIKSEEQKTKASKGSSATVLSQNSHFLWVCQ
jgi:hypothetical protein